MATDHHWMKLALRQAALGLGRTAPNPAVGCVIIDSSGNLAAEGFHEKAGEPHAEVTALRKAGVSALGGALYVTLEPCSHWGRTPPCVDAILRAGVARVVAAMVDPDPRVSGSGLQRLKEAGIRVRVGVCQAQAQELNQGYLKYKHSGLPFVLLKMAMTLDGKIATAAGDSRWVTSAPARSYVQELRDRYDAVLVGIGTALADNPSLTVRAEELPASASRTPRSPVRVILDSHARLPTDAKVIQAPGICLVLTTGHADASAREKLRNSGAEVVVIEEKNGRVDLRQAMMYLAGRHLHSVLMEGGAEVAASALEAGIADRLLFFLAPKLLGGRESPGPVGGMGPDRMSQAISTGPLRVRRFPPDIALETDLGDQPWIKKRASASSRRSGCT